MVTTTFGVDGRFLGCTIAGRFERRNEDELIKDYLDRVGFDILMSLPQSESSQEEIAAVERDRHRIQLTKAERVRPQHG